MILPLKAIVLVFCTFEFISGISAAPRHKCESHPWLRQMMDALKNNPDILQDLMSGIGRPELGQAMVKIIRGITREVVEDANCDSCKNIMALLKVAAVAIPDYDSVRQPVIAACYAVFAVAWPEWDPSVMCPGTMDLQGPHVLTIGKNFRATPEKICRNLNFCWSSSLPRVTNIHHTKREPEKPVKERHRRQDESIRVVHMADIHVDLHYAEGSPTDCGAYVCCRDVYNGTGSAGLWGSYSCNTPQRTVELVMHKAASLNPDFVLYTGDNPTHHQWFETFEEQMAASELVMEMINATLVSKNYVVYPSIGNHEPFPTNLYYPQNEEIQILNSALADWWTPAARLEEEQRATVTRAGYYTIRSTVPGLRIMTVNSNFWYAMNFYNSLNEGQAEVTEMMQFIEDTLASARENKEKVIIMIHHTIGNDDNVIQYSRWYTDIIVKYSDIIALHVAGHTHYDEFRVFSDSTDLSAKNILYTCSSVTTLASSGPINPSMRLFYLDPVTFEVLDYDEYQLDLTKDNPEMVLAYNAKDEYDLKDMSPSTWQNLALSMVDDDSLFRQWFARRHANAPGHEECDEMCKALEICSLLNTNYDQVLQCREDLIGGRK